MPPPSVNPKKEWKSVIFKNNAGFASNYSFLFGVALANFANEHSLLPNEIGSVIQHPSSIHERYVDFCEVLFYTEKDLPEKV